MVKDLILCLYETCHAGARTTIHFGIPVAAAWVIDLMENPLHNISVVDNTRQLEFQPFEIKTLQMKRTATD